jgi:hypothetical protein
MARRTIDPTDPRELAVQVSLRMPFWYREQLLAGAQEARVSLPTYVLDMLQRQITPKPPK